MTIEIPVWVFTILKYGGTFLAGVFVGVVLNGRAVERAIMRGLGW